MNKESSVKDQKKLTTQELNDLIVDSIQDIKGKNILKLDLVELEDAPTDYFIICEGESTTQVRAIANNVVKRLKTEASTTPLLVEGKDYSRWVLVDYFDTVLHVFYPETREFYELEELWSDAKQTQYENIS